MNLRTRLQEARILMAPGAYDALTARMVELAGFEAVYLSGAGVSYTLLAQPDVGLVTQTEMADRVAMLHQAVKIPVIADGDNGHGNAMNVRRAVQLYERAGASAIQLEDQQLPKRCGHMAGKKLIGMHEMVGKIKAACDARRSEDFLIIGRTDARSLLGLDAALERASAYREAGADVLFVEAPEDLQELQIIARAFPDIPLMANMVEGGKTPSLPAPVLEQLGYRLVIYPNSLIRRFAFVGPDLLASLRATGSTDSQRPGMVSFPELNTMLGLEAFAEVEQRFVPST